MINYKIFTLRQEIMNIFAKEEIPPAVAYFIIKDIYNEISEIYSEAIKYEKEKNNKSLNNSETEDSSEEIVLNITPNIETGEIQVEKGE